MSGFNPWNPYPAMQSMQPNYFNANYQPPQQAPAQMRKTNAEWVYVNGIQGARDQIVQPGCSLWMMDNNDPVAYYKAVDQMGQPTLRAFQMTEIPTNGTTQQAAAPQFDTSMFVTREEIAAIDGRLNAMDGKFNKFLQEIGGMSDG